MTLNIGALITLLLFGGVLFWLWRNAEARALVRELSRYGLYLLASTIQNTTGRRMGYVQRYRDSVARDAGLRKDDAGERDKNT